MKTREIGADTAQRQPAATQGRHEPVQAMHREAVWQFNAPQVDIDQSPRMLVQRRALDAAFGGAIQRQIDALEEGEPLQTRAAPVNETGMPNQLKAGIESLSGMDMSDVRVHRNSDKPAQLNALAYAQGNDIHLGPGQEQHLPHEAWHVVQQRQGRVRETVQMAGVGVNDEVGLEREADWMGARAVLQGEAMKVSASNIGIPSSTSQAGQGIAQCSVSDDAKEEFDRHSKDHDFAKGKFSTEQAAVKPYASGNSLAADGLLHWARETRRAAVRHYNELTSVRNMGGIDKDVFLGASNKDDPDVYIKDGSGLLEVKTNDTVDSAPVDKLVFEAFNQLINRSSIGTSSYAMHLYLENEHNVWPYVPSEKPTDFSADAVMKKMKSRAVHVSGNSKPVAINIYYQGLGKRVKFPYKFNGSD